MILNHLVGGLMNKILIALVSIFVLVLTMFGETFAVVVTSSKDEYFNSNAAEFYGFNLYWCLSPNNQYPQDGYYDFYIVKTGGTGTAMEHGLTFIKKSRPDKYGNSEPKKLIHLGFHREITVTDLNNDGVCEITAKVWSYGRKWGPNAGKGLITRIYSVINDELIDVTNKMPNERDLIYKKETDEMMEGYLSEINKEFFSSYHPDQRNMSGPLNFWYHLLAINPNSYGINLFNKHRLFTMSQYHAKEIEDALFREGYWSEEFYKTHPLLNLANN